MMAPWALARSVVGVLQPLSESQSPASRLCYKHSLSTFHPKPLWPSRTKKSKRRDPIACMKQPTWRESCSFQAFFFFFKDEILLYRQIHLIYSCMMWWKYFEIYHGLFPAVLSQQHNHCVSHHEASFMMQTSGDMPSDAHVLASGHFPFCSNDLC